MTDESRHALILSGRFGKGHDTVSEAAAVSMKPLGVDSEIVDSIALLGGAGSRVGDRVFRSLLAIPSVYDAFHFSHLRAGSWLARALDRAALQRMYPQFLRIAEGQEPELVLAVFATGVAAAARYKQTHPSVITGVLITDSYAHRMWVHDGIDVYIVASELCAHAVRSYQPRAHVAVVTHPTRPTFYEAPPQAAARARLGVPDGARCVLLMSGAWGIGPIAECASALGDAGFWVLAVAGSNERLLRDLQAVASRDHKVLAFGFSDEIPSFMSASDIVISSSGDTCREARVVGRPLVLLDVVPGHGRENLQHEIELGDATVSMPVPSSIVAAVERMLDEIGGCGGVRRSGLPPAGSVDRWEREFRAALASVGFS